MRAAVYLRVSTTSQEERGSSLTSQEAACRTLAESLGDDIVAVFQDVDSGYDEHIPGVLALTDAARRREFERVIIDHPDRFSRNLTKKVLLKHELAKTGVDIRYVSLRVDDTAEGRLTENIFAVLSEYERERINFRMSRGRRAKAERGLVVGQGWAPFGYDFDHDSEGRVVGLKPNDHALTIRRIFDLARTTSAARIADQLNADLVATCRGGRWNSSSILDMLRNTAYRGEWAYGRRDTHKHPTPSDGWIMVPCPPLVDAGTWAAVHEGLHRRKSIKPPRTAVDPYIFRSRLECGYCGSTLACVPNNGRRYYLCLRSLPSYAARRSMTVCLLPAVPADPFEAHAWRVIKDTVLDPAWVARSYRDVAKNLARERSSNAHQQRALERQIARHLMSLDQAMERIVSAMPGSDRQKAAENSATKIERTIADLRGKIEAEPEPRHDGAPTAVLQSIEAFLSEIKPDITMGDLPLIVGALDFRGLVRDDAEGERLGRHRWRINWTSSGRLLETDRVIKKTRLLFYTNDYAEWEEKNMDEVRAPRYERALV